MPETRALCHHERMSRKSQWCEGRKITDTPRVRKKREREMVPHTSENHLSHRCRIRTAGICTAGIRTFGIRTLVSFALLSLSHCWHSHCWLRTGVVCTFVFCTLVGIPTHAHIYFFMEFLAAYLIKCTPYIHLSQPLKFCCKAVKKGKIRRMGI